MIRNLLIILFFSVLGFEGYSQIASWNFTGETMVATSTAEVYNANMDASNLLTRGAGAAASSGNNSFRTQGFQNNGISTANTDYFQFTLSASPGFKMSLSNIDSRVSGTSSYGASPGASHQYAFSTDGVSFTLINSPSITVGTNQAFSVDLTSVAALQNIPETTTITFRFYVTGQTSTGGWGYFSNSAAASDNGLSINGSIVIASGCTPPMALATTPILSNITQTTADLSWTSPADGDGVIILAKANAPVDADPVSTITYTADNNFGMGSEIGVGNYVVYIGNAASVSLADLIEATNYHFEIFNYNTTGPCYMTSGLTGSFATTGPELQLEYPVATNVSCGFTMPYGSINNGSSSDQTFRIRNLGTADLVLSGLPLVIAGANANQFSIITQPVSPVTAGGFTDVVVRFSPTSSGSKVANISLVSNDGDETPCAINLTGTGVTVSMYYRSIGSGPWFSTSTWESSSDNMTWAPAIATPSSADNDITIQTGNIVTVSLAVGADQLTIETGATLEILSGLFTVADGTGTDLTVNGIWKLTDGTIITTGSVEINNAASFQYNKITATTVVVPTCTWNTGSNFEVLATGIASGFNTTANQAYYNFIWNNPTQPNGVNMSGNVHTINGDFQILNTGPTLEELRITGSAINTLNVAGNVIIDVNGILNLSNGNGISTLNIGGNITNDGGILLCSDFTSAYGNGIINLSGNLISNGSIIKVGGGTGNKLVMTGTTLQTINSSGGITSGVSLEINNAAGVKLINDLFLENDLIFTLGLFYTNDFTITILGAITGASSAKYISTSDELNVSSTNGGLSRLVDITVPANQIVEYPIGPNGIYFMPATLNANSGTDYDNFTARVTPLGTGGVTPTDATKCIQYQWEIENSGAAANINLELQWMVGTEGSNFVGGSGLVIGHWNGSKFDVIDPATYNASDPSASSLSGFTDFSPFVVASENIALPVRWLNVIAENKSTSIKVSWSTASEIDNKLFEIERSSDGKSFKTIGQKSPEYNATIISNYAFMDNNPTKGINYYRIKQIDLNGKSSFSPVASVNFDSEQLLRITNFDQRSIRISGIEGNASLQIFDVDGKVVAFRQINNNESYDFENLRNGVYFCRVENNNQSVTLKFVLNK